MRNVKVGLVQLAATDNLDANMDNAAQKVYAAAKEGAQIICLPELYRSKYFPQYERDFTHLAETIPGPSTKLFSDAAEDSKAVIIVPIYERAKGGKFYNTAAVIDADGELLGTYRKMHIPSDPGFWEKYHFSDGDKCYPVFETEYADISVLICLDQWFPEPARICALDGAEILFYPTAIGNPISYMPPEGPWQEPWEATHRGHSIANIIPVAAVNRIGVEGDTNFFGHSIIYKSFGKLLATASEDKEEVLVQEVALDDTELQKGWGFMNTRRPETYGRICDENVPKLEPKNSK